MSLQTSQLSECRIYCLLDGSSLQPSPRGSSSTNESKTNVPDIFTIRRTTYKCDETGAYEETEPHESADSPAENSKPKTGDSNGDMAEHSESESESATPPKPTEPKRFRSFDPVTWYGILVPPSLRNAQKTFTETVEGAVPELASVVVEIQTVEGEVERIRRQLRNCHG